MNRHAVTQRDIAAELGISQDAVSTALRGDKGVSEKTRARVLSTADQLGYRRNAAARAARTGRFDAAALVLQASQFYIPAYLLHGVTRGLAAQDVMTVVTEMPDDVLVSEARVPRLLRELAVDGLIIDYVPPDDHQTQALFERHFVPAIWVNAKRDRDCAFADDFDAGYRMTRKLAAAGHRRIAFTHLHNPRADKHHQPHYAVPDREGGYGKALREAGLAPHAVRVADRDRTGGPDDERIERYAAMWRSPDRPTALVGAGMTEAGAAAAAAVLCGLLPGRDVAIGCFHDTLRSDVGLPIWTWQIPHAAAGRAAAQMLLQKIESPSTHLAPRAVPYTESVAGLTLSPPTD